MRKLSELRKLAIELYKGDWRSIRQRGNESNL